MVSDSPGGPTLWYQIGIMWCLAGDYPPDSERPLALWPVAWLLVEPPFSVTVVVRDIVIVIIISVKES